MNILLINHYAGSPWYGMEYRPYYFAREWVHLGHQVQIVAASYSHYRAKQPQVGKLTRLDETIDGILYTWFKTFTYSGNGIGRVFNITSFIGRLFREGRHIARMLKPDIVIASSTYPMDIWPAHHIASIINAKLVYEVHDLWPLSPIELGDMSKLHPFIMLVQAAENYAYHYADAVVSILPRVRDYMISRGIDPCKLHIVPNGIDLSECQYDDIELPEMIKKVLISLKNQGFFIVCYTGAHGLANSLHTLIDAAILMQNENFAFLLVGSGPLKNSLQQRAKAEKLKNVIFFDAIEKKFIKALLRWVDVAYIGLQPQPLFRFGISPNKLLEYMAAGLPILMAIEAGNDPVSEAGCGLTVQPGNPQEIAQGLRYLLALGAEERKIMGIRGKVYVMRNHNYSVLAKKFLDAC